MRALLVLTFALCGFALSAWLSSRFGVADQQGLAGAAIVFGYGFMGGLVGAVLAFFIPRVWLLPLFCITAIPAAIVAVLLVTGYFESREKTREHLQAAYASLPPYELTIEVTGEDGEMGFRDFHASWPKGEWYSHTSSRRCEGSLLGTDAVRLLTALRSAELITYRNPAPCTGAIGTTGDDAGDYRLSFFIQEAKPPITSADVLVSERCLLENPQLAAPLAAVLEVVGTTPDGVQCHARED